jgi:predicted AAA+ superfamily ATPase
MDDNLIRKTLDFYNPFWRNRSYLNDIPLLRRDVYDEVFQSVKDIKQIISITGPRRVGKTTMLRQIIADLIEESNIDPLQILYISMDDPYIYSNSSDSIFFDRLIEVYEKYILREKIGEKKIYFLIDEIHKFKDWQLFLKKYYDRGINIKFVISGSVEQSILGKSKESLAGRIKNFKIYTFSFYEYIFYKLSFDDKVDIAKKEILLKLILKIHEFKLHIFSNPLVFFNELSEVLPDFIFYEDEVFTYFYEYLIIGGFIESWSMEGSDMQYEYLYQTQIEKVLLQDIYILEDIKNTKTLATLFFKFSENFSSEYSLNSLVKDMGVHRDTIERYISLLKDSNLIFTLSKYGENANKISSIKIFLVDIGIRNSILKIKEEEIIGNKVLFFKYIENLSMLSLIRYSSALSINYYRERDKEINFILNYSSKKIAINISERKKNVFEKFKFDYIFNLLDTTEIYKDENVISIPYILFLLVL